MTVAPSEYTARGEVLIRPAALEQCRNTDSVIFDVDGVLVDVSQAIQMVDCEVVQFYVTNLLGWEGAGGSYITPAEVEEFKLAGGFNEDQDIACAAVMLLVAKAQRIGVTDPDALREAQPTIPEVTESVSQLGGGLPAVRKILIEPLDQESQAKLLASCDQAKILQLCQEFYAGEDHCREFYGYDPEYVKVPGRLDKEVSLLDREKLTGRIDRWGLFTGRTWSETKWVLDNLGVSEFFCRDRVVTCEDAPHKPNPAGLAQLMANLGAKVAVFVGDMPDDREAVRRYRDSAQAGYGEVISCLVLSGPFKEKERSSVRGLGADIIAPEVNAFLDWLNGELG